MVETSFKIQSPLLEKYLLFFRTSIIAVNDHFYLALSLLSRSMEAHGRWHVQSADRLALPFWPVLPYGVGTEEMVR